MGRIFVDEVPGQNIREFFAARKNSTYSDGSVGRALDCAVVNMYGRVWVAAR